MPLTLTTGLNLGGSNRGGLRLSPVTGFSAPAIRHNISGAVNLTSAAQLSGGNVSADTTAPLWDGATGHLRVLNGTSTVYHGHTPDAPWDLTDGYLRATLRLTNLATTAGMVFRLADSAASYAAGNYISCASQANSTSQATTANWLPTGTWVHEAISPRFATVTGTGITNLASVGHVLVGGRSTTGTVTFDIARLEKVAYSSAKAKMVIWHDDTVAAGATALAARMAVYGFPWTEALEVEMLGQSTMMTTSAALAYQAGGVQFGSHSTTSAEHTQDSVASIEDQARRNYLGQKAAGLRGGYDMAWWGGQSVGSPYLDVIRAKYRSGRGNTLLMQTPEMLPPAEPWLYKALLAGTSNTYATHFKPYTDAVIAAKGLGTIVFHQDLAAPGQSNAYTTEVETLLAYLDANRATIDVVTINDALASSTL